MVLDLKNANSNNLEGIRSVSPVQKSDCCVWFSVHVHRGRATEGIWRNFSSEGRWGQCVKNYLSKITQNKEVFPMKEGRDFKWNPLIKNATAHFHGISAIPHSTLCTLNIFTIKGYARRENDWSHFSRDDVESRFFPKKILNSSEKISHLGLFCSNLTQFFPMYFLIEQSGNLSS